MAWTDLSLKLMDRFLSPVVKAQTAHMLLVDPRCASNATIVALPLVSPNGTQPLLRLRITFKPAAAKTLELPTWQNTQVWSRAGSSNVSRKQHA